MNLFDAPPVSVRMQNWLGQDRVERLLDYAADRQHHFRPSRYEGPEGRRVEPNVRHSQRIGCTPEIADLIEQHVRAALPALRQALGESITPRAFEIELVAHGDGAFFSMHRDTGPGRPHDRTVSGIYYFHRQPKRFSGGQLRLYGVSGKSFIDIEPENDSVVFFPSWFPHEVLPVSCPSAEFMDARFAINCWIRR